MLPTIEDDLRLQTSPTGSSRGHTCFCKRSLILQDLVKRIPDFEFAVDQATEMAKTINGNAASRAAVLRSLFLMMISLSQKNDTL